MKKRFTLLMTMVIALCTSSAWGASASYVQTATIEAEEATLSFADKAQRTSYSTEQQVWEQDGITFINSKAKSTNDVADYANPVRLYKGSSVTVTIKSGYEMTGIVFVSDGTAKYKTALEGSLTASGYEYTNSGNNYTVALDPATKSFNIVELTAQARLKSLSVSYVKIGGEDVPVVPEMPKLTSSCRFLEEQEVVISCSTEGATIYYTMDGTDPTVESTVYSEPFTVYEATTVKAFAVNEVGSSDIVEATYTKAEYMNIAGVVADGEQNAAITSGTVVATYAKGFLIGDDTGYILTFLGKESGLATGDVVTVTGATSMYGGLLQFSNTSTFEKTGTAQVTLPEPEVLDAAAMDALVAAPAIKFVQYTGTLAISGNYYNVNVAGTEKAIGSIQYPAEGVVNADWNGKEIIVTGFVLGVSGGKYLNTMAVSVVAAEEEPAVKTDYTDAIKNASVAENAEWEGGLSHGNGGLYKTSAESFDFTQTIVLPAGQYKMTAQAAYRYAGSNDGPTAEEYEYNQIQAGAETHLAKLYAQTATYKYEVNVQNRWEGASETNYAGDGVSTVNGLFVPNSSNAVKDWFDNGMYVNELVFNVQEEGEVKIGVAKATKAPNGDYTNIGAWTLTRLGDAEADPKEEEPTPDPEEPEETIDMDLTHLVGTSKEAWNAAGGPVNIDGISMPEKYEETTATLGDVMWQTVEGLDNGTYTVELWANARYTAGRGFESAATDGQLECTFLYANNVEISIPVVYNPDLNNNTSHVLEGVEVTDGTLKMGMTKKADGSNWHTIQIKSLIYHAPANAALDMAKVDLQAALDAANAVEPKKDDFVAAIAAAQDVYDNSKVVEEIEAATATLKEATKLAILGNASPSNPVLTDFVINGTFDTTTAPWQTTTGAQNKALASNQQGAFTGNFFENWNPSNYTGKIYQVIENIPNGLYELSICAFVNQFKAGAHYVYANADKKDLVAGAPTAYTVRTTVADNKIEIGLEQIEAVNEWMGIDNVSLKFFGEVDENYAKDMYASTKAAAEALLGEKMSAEAKAALEAALAVEVDETSDEALIAAEAALQEVMATVKVSVNFYASNKKAIDAMFALMESTNVYTAEAFAAYSAKAEDFLAQYEADTLTATVDNPAAIHGWHASVDYDDLLLSAFGVKDFDTNLYINTWSNEGETDGSEFKVPFFEYWTGDDASLGATTKTATMTGLTPGQYYSVEAWVRTRAKNGVAAADATGITLCVGAGEEVDVTEGVVVGESQFAHAVYTAIGAADENGTLTISFNVLADNNVSWLSFKNLKYTEIEMLNVVGAKVGDVDIVEGAATVESISTIDVTFDRPVALAESEDPVWATLTDKWGDTSLKAEVLEENNCVVRFSLQWDVYTEAGDYYFYVPVGVVVDAENADIANAAIEAVITIEAAPVEPATPLAVVNVTVGENVMEGFSVEAKPTDMIKVNFDGKFYFQGSPVIVDAEGNEAPMAFEYMNGLDLDGSNSYILMGKTAGIYTITLPKAQFNEYEMMGWKAPAEDIVLTVKIVTEGEGIDNIAVDADTVIYDLSGRRVTEMTKGIYIVNGKKVIKK